MRVVVAVGGNALLRRRQAPTAAHQLDNVRVAAAALAAVARDHELVVVHGNGPQVGLLAMQSEALPGVAPYPLDMLGAETDGLIGYLLEQEIDNQLPAERCVATLLTRVRVDADDPAFDAPSKPIGALMDPTRAQALMRERGWAMAEERDAQGPAWRRVVPSPAARALVDARPIGWLLERGAVVICGGGGGIPVVRGSDGRWRGVEAVIDKDDCAALIAATIDADRLVIATDVDAVYADWGAPSQRALGEITAAALARQTFAAGSMGPKVRAACTFAGARGRIAAIGALEQIAALVAGEAGTQVLPT
jgi:carbamate kinase